MNREWSGRDVFLVVGVLGVAFAAVMGAFIGAQAEQRGRDVVAFGVLELPASPVAVGAYATGIAVAVVLVTFGAVTIASRRVE